MQLQRMKKKQKRNASEHLVIQGKMLNDRRRVADKLKSIVKHLI